MVQKLINICFATLFLVALLSAQSTKPRVFYLGHSLINFEIPNMVNKLTQDAKLNLHYQAHIGNGANFHGTGHSHNLVRAICGTLHCATKFSISLY